jgi:lipopolysaccharide transport system ATP-binding protein
MTQRESKEPVIELRKVGFFYMKRTGYFSRRKFWALKRVSFVLRKGESLGVIGKNGAGKSTLLKLLASIIKPDQGELVNHGYTTTLLSLQAGFIPYLTGKENAFLNGMYLGLEKQLIAKQIQEIKDFSGLDDFFDLPISSYSSGMRARLGFSIAFQLNPDIILIDEALGAGDMEFREKSSEKMKELIRSSKTVVLVSHSPAMIDRLCDRAVLIEQGETLAEGDTSKVIRTYEELLKHSAKENRRNVIVSSSTRLQATPL